MQEKRLKDKGIQGADDILRDVHYFEATDCIDNELKDLLNNKLIKIRNHF